MVRKEAEVLVVKNDEITVQEVGKLNPQGILISPGPGRPVDGGVSMAVVQAYFQHIPILGVCLGHQILGEVFGSPIVLASRPMHGHTSPIYHQHTGLFKGLPNPLKVMRYHSLVIDPLTLPDELMVTAMTHENEIMGIQHKFLPLFGVQFHPESILSEGGAEIIKNWLQMICT